MISKKLKLLCLLTVLSVAVTSIAYAFIYETRTQSLTQTVKKAWYDQNWQYRKQITINYSKVSANLTDFPVLISQSTDANLASHARNDGWDIVFTSSDKKTKLNHEIETYNSTIGKLVAWVKVPTISNKSNTVLYMYYGNPNSGNQQNSTNVWSSFQAVWHLKEDPATTAPQVKDSTTGANDGTSGGTMTSSDLVTAKINGGLDFDGINDVIDAGNKSSLDNKVPFTFSAWVYPRSMGGQNDGRIVHKGSTTARKQLQIDSGTVNGYGLYVDRSSGTANALSVNNAVLMNQWQYVCGTYSESDGPRIYVNGVEVTYATRNVGSGTTVSEALYDFYIGNRPGADKGWNGTIDEVRVSSLIRSQAWITTEYNNQNSPITFYNVASEETK